jgi:hypothetical protein
MGFFFRPSMSEQLALSFTLYLYFLHLSCFMGGTFYSEARTNWMYVALKRVKYTQLLNLFRRNL